jgi:hypothetical protein
MLVDCVAIANTSTQIDTSGSMCVRCIGVRDHTVGTSTRYIFSLPTVRPGFAYKCTAYQTGSVSLANDIAGFRVASAYPLPLLIDCIVEGVKNSGGQDGVGFMNDGGNSLASLFAGCVAYDCDIRAATDAGVEGSEVTAVSDGGPANTDPDFNAPGSFDFTPNTDMLTTAYITKLLGETSWEDPGALSHLLLGGGGGGGGLPILAPSGIVKG